jgi:hypothetical protein
MHNVWINYRRPTDRNRTAIPHPIGKTAVRPLIVNIIQITTYVGDFTHFRAHIASSMHFAVGTSNSRAPQATHVSKTFK